MRRYVTVAVLIAMAYLFVELLSHPLPSLTAGSWSGFSIAVDTTVAVAVSWVPMAADYARHSRSSAAAFTGAFVGMAASDINGTAKEAVFTDFVYRPVRDPSDRY